MHLFEALLVRELRRAREGLVDKQAQQLALGTPGARAQLDLAETLALGALEQSGSGCRAAEEPVRVKATSAAGRGGMRRSEKANVPEKA
jgi:hypothetical protein